MQDPLDAFASRQIVVTLHGPNITLSAAQSVNQLKLILEYLLVP